MYKFDDFDKCIQLSNHHQNPDIERFPHSQRFDTALCSHTSPTPGLTPIDLLCVTIFLPYTESNLIKE